MAGHGITGVSPIAERGWRLAAVALSKDIETVKRTIEAHYGFVPTDAYCRDFVEFVMAVVLEPDGGNRVARK